MIKKTFKDLVFEKFERQELTGEYSRMLLSEKKLSSFSKKELEKHEFSAKAVFSEVFENPESIALAKGESHICEACVSFTDVEVTLGISFLSTFQERLLLQTFPLSGALLRSGEYGNVRLVQTKITGKEKVQRELAFDPFFDRYEIGPALKINYNNSASADYYNLSQLELSHKSGKILIEKKSPDMLMTGSLLKDLIVVK